MTDAARPVRGGPGDTGLRRLAEALSLARVLPVVSLAGIAVGATAWLAGARQLSAAAWALTTTVVMLPLAVSVARQALRRSLGVDLIALAAMAGSLALGEYLAGAVIALMLSGGQALEAYASGRARRELLGLASRAPRLAHRLTADGLDTVAAADVRPGDRLLVKTGEVLPVDGVLTTVSATLDESALTGEARPAVKERGDRLESGVVNTGIPLEMRATAAAAASTYAGIVRLAEEAQRARAPFVRLADRYAVIFLPVSFAIAGAAWLLSGDPVRGLAVLVVATPCPLILAAPVAIVSGISRIAGRGVIIKNGAALEALARGTVLLIDKTGTLTTGRPQVSELPVFGGADPDEVLALAGSLEQVSTHVFAQAVVTAANHASLELSFPSGVVESAGTGIRGFVDGHEVALGRYSWVADGVPPDAVAERLARRSSSDGRSTVFVAVDGRMAGALVLEDQLRPDATRTIRALRRAGIRRLVLVTGDHPEVAAAVAEAVGADRVLAEHSPAEKVEAVRQERANGVVLMVGDGINDAAALAAADVGVAIGARGATASSEAADAVLVADRLDRLGDAMELARRSRRIAVQSVVAGMTMSAVAMVVAAAGGLAPVAGAVIQEAIDVAVILNALRALQGGISPGPGEAASRLGLRFQGEHAKLAPALRELHLLARALDSLPAAEARQRLLALRRVLVEELVPHELAEDAVLYPEVAKVMGGDDPTGVMSRAHLEISHLVRRISNLVDEVGDAEVGETDRRELQRALYSLDAIMRLHMAQEEEAYLPLFER